jgi:hypothetical protein
MKSRGTRREEEKARRWRRKNKKEEKKRGRTRRRMGTRKERRREGEEKEDMEEEKNVLSRVVKISHSYNNGINKYLIFAFTFIYGKYKNCVRFEVFRAVTAKNTVFWDVNRRFGGSIAI